MTARRLDPAAIGGVMSREVTVFLQYWRSTTFSSIVEPCVYLLAFGLGFGALVSRIGGLSYIQYVGTGTVSTAVLFSSIFPAMFTSFVRRRFQRTYDALLAAPVDVEELVTAEALWLAVRAGVYGCAPLLVAIVFGLRPGAGALLIPIVNFVCGLGFAFAGIFISGLASSINNFSYVTSAVITPLFLLAGTYFPVSGLPGAVATAAHFNPLFHSVQLVRHAVLGLHPGADALHLLVLFVFALVMWRLAVWSMTRRLID